MNEPTDEQLVKSAKTIGFISFIIGVVFVFLANTAVHQVAVVVALIGLGFIVLGIVVIGKGAEMGRAYLEKQHEGVVEDVVEQSLVEDRKGIVWVWIVAIITWAILAVAYFSLSMVVYLVLDQVETFYSLPESYLQTITLTRNVTGWFLIIMTVGVIGWALINSARRETATYPV